MTGSSGYPVRCGFSIPSLALRNTGSPAGACHRAALRADPLAGDDGLDSIFKQQRVYGHSFAISPRISREFC
jgi:hypothetical protein